MKAESEPVAIHRPRLLGGKSHQQIAGARSCAARSTTSTRTRQAFGSGSTRTRGRQRTERLARHPTVCDHRAATSRHRDNRRPTPHRLPEREIRVYVTPSV
jgi:hypothetical protein